MALMVSAHAYGVEAQEALVAAIERFKSVGGRYDPLARVTIVVPTALAGYEIRRLLGRRAGGIVNVQVKPLQGLLELIGSMSLANAGRRPLPAVYRAETIRLVTEQGSPVFGDVPIDGPVLQNLLQRFSEFDDCDREQLDTMAAQPGMPGYLVALYDEYLKRTENFYTTRDLTQSATDAVQQQPTVIRDIGSIIVYLPRELTSAQRRFLQAISERAQVAVLLGLTGDVETVDQHTLRSWGLEPVADMARVPTAQQIVQSPDAEEEIRSAIREITSSLLAERPIPLYRTAILYRQPDPYARICAEQLDAAGIVWNGSNSQTLRQSIAGRTLDGLLGLMSKSTISWVSDVAAWLTAAPIRDTDGALAPTARWNQLARRANLQRGPDDWLIRLERYRARCVDDLERLRRTADESKPGRLPWVEAEIGQIDELMKFAGQLVQFARQTLQTANWSGHAQHARGQLEQLLGDRNAFAVYASGEDDLELARWDDVQLLLTELSWLDDLDQATPERFASAARRELERPTGHHGRVGDGVYVGPLHSAVGMHWDVVYIVGVTERSLPQTHSEDSLLSEQVRLRASLPVATDYIRRERANYLVALHSAERRVLSYPRADVRAQRAKLPSRWLLESATELNLGVRVYASKIDQAPPGVIRAVPSFEQAVTSADMPADIHEFDLKSLRRSVQPQDHYLAAFSAPLGRGFLQHDERRRPALTRWDGLIADGVADVISQPQSAGALQDWATCPYRYFLGRVLRIAERDESRDELQITPVDKGSLIHDILEQFFKQSPAQPSPGERWSDHERQRLSSIATQHFDAARAQGLIGRDLLWRRDQRRIANDLQTLLDEDDRHRAAHQARQIASELVFGELPDSEASVDLRLADGSVIRLRGMIDRVDRSLTDGRLMVIDYKTGSEYPKGEELEQDAIIGGQYLQLPIYAHAARQVYELDEEEIVRSAYWYITARGDFTYNAVEWNAENTKRFQWAINLIIENIRAGRFPANPGDAHHRSRGQHCMFCSFDAICPVDRRRHWQNIQAAPQLADYLALSEPPEKRA